jgi:hypothetical protein
MYAMSKLSLINEPISTKNYSIYNIDKLPKVFLGIRVKNKFDEKRMKIKTKYKPKLISHFKMEHQLEPVFLYGIEIKLKPIYTSLAQTLNKWYPPSSVTTLDDYLVAYKRTLSEFNLSCDTCYRYLSDGFYPIDIQHLSAISKKDYDKEIKSGFDTMIAKSESPWYLNLRNFNLFILGQAIGYDMDYRLL